MPAPTVRRRRLSKMLKSARVAAKINAETAAEELGMALSTLYYIEKNGTSKVRDVLAMSKVYGIDQTSTEYIAELARRAGKRGWWAPYSGSTSTTFQDYLSLEEDAIGIRSFENQFVPALIQTRAYATEITRRTWSTIKPGEDTIQQRVDLRMDRQDAAFKQRDKPLSVDMIVHESALRIVVGNPELMVEQLKHVQEAASWPHVDLRILPSVSGAYAGMQGAFVILDFPELIDPPVIYVEYLMGSVYLEDAREIDGYRLAFDRMRKQALDPDQSVKLIGEITSDLVALRA